MSMKVAPMASAVCILALSIVPVLVQAINSCDYDAASCGCKTDQGLLSLKKYENKALQANDPSQNGEFHWNPCKDITIGTTTAACIQASAPLSYDCGTHASTASSVKDGVATFHLVSAILDRQSEIKCVCKSGEEFKFIKEDPVGFYYLELSSEACCPGGSASGGSSEGLSGGSILLILFFCLVFVYVAGGVALQVGVRKAEGMERIPNVTFWAAVPGLVKDGFRFTFSCGKYPSYGEL